MDNPRMTCIAIDDEPLALKQLETYISKTPSLEFAGGFTSAFKAKEFLEGNSVDVIFLDINMPDVNGMEFARSLSSPSFLVFTTAYSEYAVESYRVDAIDYLLKPFSLEEFQQSVLKVRKQWDLLNKTVREDDDTIFLKADYKTVMVRISDIRYVEGMGEYLKIFMEGQKLPLVVLMSMKKMGERLSGKSFMRVHKSYIVNLKKIKAASRSRITMESSEEIPVGDIYRDNFISYIESKFPDK